MAKTSTTSRRRRERRPNVPPYTGPIVPAEDTPASSSVAKPSATSTRPSVGRSSLSASSIAGPVDFRREYAYVLKDLRSMGIVAAVMLALLVALNFIVP